MRKELARKLLILVNDRNLMSLLDDYIQYRIETLRDYLEKSPTGAEIHRGCLLELRRFATLRDEVHKAAE